MDSTITYKITDSKHFSSKVTCFSKLRAIKVIAEKLSDVQLEMFSRSCFGKLFHMNELKFAGQLVHNLLLRQVECDESDELWFALPNDSVIRFSMQEFGIVTGLDCGPYPKDESNDECTSSETFSHRIFNGSSKVSNKSLDATFRGASSDNDEDIVKLALLYFLEMVLLGKDPKNQIRREHILLLDDINAFNKYPWGRCCYDMTLSGMKKDFKKMAANVGKRHKGHTYKADGAFYSLSGFPYAFQIWACEAIPTIGQQIALKSRKLLPRILSWSSTAIPKSGEIVTLLYRSDLQAYPTLEATTAEENEDYCQYFVRKEEGATQVSFDSVACDGVGNGKNDNIDKSTAAAFLEAQPSRRRPYSQVTKDNSNAHIDQLQAIQKQLEQFKEETTNLLQHTNKNLEDTKMKVQETANLLQETNKKVDMIIDFLFGNNVFPTQQNPSASKYSDDLNRETIGDSTEVEGSLPVAVDRSAEATHEEVDSFDDKMTGHNLIVPPKVWLASPSIGSGASVKIMPQTKIPQRKQDQGPQLSALFSQFEVGSKKWPETSLPNSVEGSAEVTHAKVDSFRGKMILDPVLPWQPILGSPSHGSDVSLNIIQETNFFKRKREKGPQISSPSQRFKDVPRKRTKFKPFPKPFNTELQAFKAWRDEHVLNELPTVRLPTGDCNRQWFRNLSKTNVWLTDSHMDAAFCFIRWKSIRSPTSKMEAFTTTDILFGQHLLSKWDGYTKKKDIWDDDDMCVRYARGEVASNTNTTGEVACRPWAGLTTLYMPLNYRGVHWVLVKVHFNERTITLFDSLGTYVRNYKQFLQPIATLLPSLLQKTDHYRKDAHMTPNWYKKEGWTLSRCNDTPQQEAGSGDCGIFVIKLAEHMANGMAVDSFDKSHIPDFREQLALDLWKWSHQLWEVSDSVT